jgi:hypothetical protein
MPLSIQPKCAPVILITGALAWCGCGSDSSKGAEAALFESHATAHSVPAPDYALDVSGITTIVDAQLSVESATGSASLTEGTVLAERFAVVNAAGLFAYADIDLAYVESLDAAVVLTIPAESFDLAGADLSLEQVRTLILANVSNDVRSYQAFEIVFRSPSP